MEAFNQVDLTKRQLDKKFIKSNYVRLYNILVSRSAEAKVKFKRIVMSDIQKEIYCANISVLKLVISNLFSEYDYVYSDYKQKICVGFSQEGIDNYINQWELEFEEFNDYYEGISYNIMTVSDVTYVWEKRLWLEAQNWLYTLEMHYGDVPVYQACVKGTPHGRSFQGS